MNTESTPLNPVREVIFGWEKLRILFNVLQLALGLLLSWGLPEAFGGIHVYAFWVMIYGITVNVFYCLGPLAEIYLVTLAPARLPFTRMFAFVAGTAFALAVTSFLAIKMQIQFMFHHGAAH